MYYSFAKLTFCFLLVIIIYYNQHGDDIMEIESIHALWQEKPNFILHRNKSESYWVFIHFLSPIYLELDGKEIYVESGGCIIFKPYSYRHFESRGCALIHNWFHFSGDLGKYLDYYNLLPETIYYCGNDKIVTNIIQHIETELARKELYYKDICKAKINELFALISRYAKNKDSYVDHNLLKSFVSARCELLNNYATSDINIDSFAKKVNLSTSRFYIYYRQIFHTSPKQDLINTRIEHAKQLLLQKNIKISVIAEQSGYNNPYHFIRQFKNVIGVSPGEFRRQHNII